MKTRTLLIASLILTLALPCIAQDSANNPLVFPVCRKDNPQNLCATPPKPIHDPNPKYPRTARKDRIQGKVVLETIVGADGVPSSVTVTQSLRADFDKSAVNTIYRWRFSPGTHDGKPVAVKIKIEISFRLYGRNTPDPHP
jgi:TonB family protein